MKMWKKIGAAIALTACTGLLGAGVITSAEDAAETQEAEVENETDGEDVNEVVEKLGGELKDDSVKTIQEVCREAMPAMVAITNTTVEEVQNYFRGDPFDFFGYGFFDYYGGRDYNSQPQTRESVSMGSGVIISIKEDEILIATNEHVVNGATTLSVAFIDDSAAPAEIVGSDAKHDLAVIKVQMDELTDETKEAIGVIPFGSSADLEVGESVVAIGNALGYGQSVSSGIVSALNRSLVSRDSLTGAVEQTDGMIQTDASINPGNSGGALLNLKGELIGINSAKYADTMVEGMGYAIPIDTVEPIVTDIANGKNPDEEGYTNDDGSVRLGVTVTTITEEFKESYALPYGVYVVEVQEGSPADYAGVESGDIITAIDDTAITTVEELKAALLNYSEGDSARLTISRQSSHGSGSFDNSFETGTLTVTFGDSGEYHMAA